MDWLRKLFPLEVRPQPKGKEAPQETLLQGRVAFWGPAYDLLTEETSSWLRDFTAKNGIADPFVILGPDVQRAHIQTLLLDGKGLSVAIFCGHGSDDHLLGPPEKGSPDVEVDGRKHGSIYCQEMISVGPQSIFAFSCRTASKLGKAFVSHSGRTYLGFDGEIPLNFMNDECTDTWKSVVARIVQEINKDGAVKKKHAESLQAMYDQVYAFFSIGPGKRNDQELLMRAQILRHKKLLRFYEGA